MTLWRRAAHWGGALVLSLLILLAGIALLLGCAQGDVPAATSAVGTVIVTESTVPAEPEPAPATTVSLAMVGDVLVHPGVYQSGDRGDGTYNFDHLFTHVAADIAVADVAIVNQETVLGGVALGLHGGTDGPTISTGDSAGAAEASNAEGGNDSTDNDADAGDAGDGAASNTGTTTKPTFIPVFNSPQEIGDAEVVAGFDVVLKATNHAMDMGYEGLGSELAFWRTTHPEIAVIGAVEPGTGSAASAEPYVYEKDNLRVAVLNFANGLNGFDDPDGAVSMLSETNVRAGIRRAHELADIVVVCPHWGIEYETVPSEGERAWAAIMLDEGVDVVIGTHPHVIQPVEVLTRDDGHHMLVFWSLGNFVSFQLRAATMVGGMAKVTFAKDASGARVSAWELDVLVTHRGTGTDTTTYKLGDYTDELAHTNSIRGTDGTVDFTRAWCDTFAAGVLGEDFDVTTGTLAATLG